MVLGSLEKNWVVRGLAKVLDQIRQPSVLGRLWSANDGNAMIITAAMVVPLLVIGGSAVDIGRMMLVRNRLQQACDASALAYRRSMSGSNVNSDTESTAKDFFSTNFNAHRYGAGVPTVSFSVDSQVVVHGTASVSLPMTIMSAFGRSSTDLNVTCDAQMQLPNSDVMFVLDTTGSMTDTNAGDTVSKIAALKQAVITFYKSLEKAKVSGTQVRYGFVPYSNTVNVGTLLKREWMVDAAVYQSREYDHQQVIQTGTTGTYQSSYTAWTPNTYTTSTFYGAPENCVAPANTLTTVSQTAGPWSPSATSVPRSRVHTRTINGSSYSASTQSDGRCLIRQQTYSSLTQTLTETYSVNPNGGTPTYSTYNYWNYAPVTYDVRALKGNAANGLISGGTLTVPIATPASNASNPPTTGANYTFGWTSSNACIEERKTLRSDESGTAYDMDVDMVPTASNPDTQWRPFLPNLVFARSVGWYNPASAASTWPWSYPSLVVASDYQFLANLPNDRAACPSPARKLMSAEDGLTESVLQNYVGNLKTGGDTYHDIGFLWGLRLASAQGLFAAENSSAPNGFDISRNIIFMTDGATETHIQDYDAYGLSALDRRRTPASALPTDSAQNTIVENRLLQYCTAAKAKGMTVWVVAFGTSLTSLLQNCASSGRAYQANNASDLNQAFSDIASRIAQLRLTR